MFVGHYAAALAAKAAEPRAPLWAYVAGAQLIEESARLRGLPGAAQPFLEQALAQTASAYAGHAGFGGFAIHHFESYVEWLAAQ